MPDMANKHTPGPWSVFDLVFRDQTYGIDGPQGEAVVFFGYDSTDGIRRLEDARLIAAAPDLLEALDELLRETVDMDLKYGIELSEGEELARAKALAAIAKATGGE